MMLSHRPGPPLDALVHTLWASERGPLPHAREFNLPTGCADIVIPLLDHQAITRYADSGDTRGEHFAGAVLHGAHDRAMQRDTWGPSSVVGVHFKPGGAAAFFGGALPELRNRSVLLDDLWGPSARVLREQLQALAGAPARLRHLHTWLLARLQRAAPADAMVLAALRTLAQQPAAALIEPLQRASGCAPAAFIARFERSVGLTPKRYARVLRFHSLIQGLARQVPDDWAQAAVDAGYADQSHLIHEFKRLVGITPTAYRAVAPDHPTHMVVGPEKAEKISNTRQRAQPTMRPSSASGATR